MNKKLLGMVALACIVGFAGCDDSSSDDAKKACGSVAHDAMTCNADGTQLAKCNDGKLEDLTGEGKCSENQVCAITDGKAACKDKATDAKKACGSVAHDAMTCNADGTQLAKCNDGTLEDLTGEGKCTEKQICAVTDGKAACKDVTGDDKKACGSVAHDAMTCNADGTQLAKCNNGTLEDFTGEGKCTANQTCAIENNKAVCKDKSEDMQLDCDNAKHGELVCKDDKMAKCVNGDIVDAEGAEACATGKVCGKSADGKATCFDAGSRPCGSTVHGAKACNGEKIATCNDGKLVNDEGVTQCVDRETHCVATDAEIACVAFKKCGEGDLEINHNSYGCDGDRMVLCYDGEKVEPAADRQCTGSTVCRYLEEKGVRYAKCIDPTACDELKNGEKKCNDEGTQILVCTNGELKEATGDAACTAEQICVKDGASVKCDKKPEQSIPALHKEMMNLIPDNCATTDPEIVAKSIKVQGTITAIGSTGAIVYIQDSTVADGKHAAVQVFCNNEKSSGEKHLCSDSFDTFKKSFAIGDRIEVIADGVGVNKCQPRIEMKTNKIVVNVIEKAGTQIKPIVLNASDIASSNIKNEYNGTLATVNGLTITGKSGKNRNAKDGNDNVLNIFSRLMMIKDGTFESGTYNITGIVANFKTAGLMPRSESDFAEIK